MIQTNYEQKLTKSSTNTNMFKKLKGDKVMMMMMMKNCCYDYLDNKSDKPKKVVILSLGKSSNSDLK